jgi:hypothetical protein
MWWWWWWWLGQDGKGEKTHKEDRRPKEFHDGRSEVGYRYATLDGVGYQRGRVLLSPELQDVVVVVMLSRIF